MTSVRTSPPAKLNLFLEVPARREDGFHQIDTVMAAINWCDELLVESIPEPTVKISARWLPSRDAVAGELGIELDGNETASLLNIPTDRSNLVVAALERFRDVFRIDSGFRVKLGKRIPAGAGMGGASSDAAHAISCASQIHHLHSEVEQLHEIASSIGSDVPFFLPQQQADGGPVIAALAEGRGEILTPIATPSSMHFVVAYPAAALSTAEVYRRLRVPTAPKSSARFLTAFQDGDRHTMLKLMMNRLTAPALEILPRLRDLEDSLWQSGVQTCQLTGSGSAMFAVVEDAEHALDVVRRLRIELQPGVLLRAAHTVPAAAPIETVPS